MRDAHRRFSDSTLALSVREGLSGFPDPDVELSHPFRQRPARHFIVTHGRSGSSLLAALLDDCGADFGAASSHGGDTFKQHWASSIGQAALGKQHWASSIGQAALGKQHWASSIGKVARSSAPSAAPTTPTARSNSPWMAADASPTGSGARAKHHLRGGLKRTPYSKNRGNTTILPLVEQLGWRPVLIISYRSPAEVAMSDMLQLKNAASTFLPMIMKVYVDSLYSLQRYGGVVIDHAELVDPRSEGWAHGLSTITGFAPSRLLDARNRPLQPARPRPTPNVWAPPELESIAAMLGERRNRPLAPSV